MAEDTPILPAHLEDTVRSIAELHAEHDRRASFYQRSIARLIEYLGRPAAVGVIVTVMLLWIGVNVVEEHLHVAPFDSAPFAYLQGLVAAAACS